MGLFVHPVFAVGERNLLFARDRLVQNLDGVEKLVAARQRAGQRADVRQPRAEVDAGQVLDLADEARALAFRQAAGGKQAVDEQPQLGVGERALDVPAGAEGAVLAVGAGARALVAADGIAAGLQFQQVAPDRLAVGGHPVFGLEQPQELLLGKAVVFVGILAQQLQQVEREHLFRLQGICHIGASFRKEFCRAAAMRDHVPARRRCETAAVRN